MADKPSEIKGKVKEQVGKLLGNERMEAEGTAEKEAAVGARRVEGTAEEVKGRVKSAAGDVTDDPGLQVEGESEAAEGRVKRD